MLISCKQKQPVDLIIHNAIVYTVDSDFSIREAIAIKDHKIVSVGTNDEISGNYSSPETIDAERKGVFPGFIDAHCHFYGYGKSLQQVNLTATKSFDEVIDRIVTHSQKNKTQWITGRGWDQNDWQIKQFPAKDTLDKLFPNTPVFISRIDGHAALVNQAAIEQAAISVDTKIQGGEIEIKNGGLTGILIDNAIDLVSNIIPDLSEDEKISSLLNAQQNCFSVGLTTVDDAGLDKLLIDLIDSQHSNGSLKIRIYAMVNPTPENKAYYFKHGIYKTDLLNVRSFKAYADGSLGSRGACLLQPYSDRENHYGFILNPVEYYTNLAEELYKTGFQMNTHCIGDSANRLILNIYAKNLQTQNNLRWRIEHAQVVNKNDLSVFAQYKIIPSVQPTHATSDMYWAPQRLGAERINDAYTYKDLLDQNNMLASGSDFPVEHINPLYGFYAAVARKDLKGFPENGFQPGNKLSRQQALKAMTIWAAYANFEETEKGSIEPGKFADFVILDNDIMTIEESQIPDVKVLSTYVGGEKVYDKNNFNP